jgi:pilus assembly protein CpaB
MNRNRLIIGLAFAVLIGFLLSAFVYRTFRQMSGVKTAPVQAHIVVAAHPMQLGTRLDANSVQLIPWPSGVPIQGMFTRIEDCVGRALITPVAENEPILEAKLASMEAGAGLPATIPEGMRAISVAVNDIVAVAGFVIPGTMVDVLVTANASVGGGATDSMTQTILENVRVLAAGQQIQQDRDGKPVAVPVITLLVTPDDAAKLAMASTEGKIQLALRNTIDTKLASPAPVMSRVLFAGRAAPPPRQPGSKAAPVRTPPPFVIEVITGNKRETKTFPNP